MQSPAVEKVDSPVIKKALFDDLELVLDLSNSTIEDLDLITKCVEHVVFNENEYMIICNRLLDIYSYISTVREKYCQKKFSMF